MTDPRLNSIHLDAERRQEFRRARELLLNARGYQTVIAEQQDDLVPSIDRPNTIIQNRKDQVPPELPYWLMDKEFYYPLRVGLNTIGRAPDNDVVIPDAYVSRRHCAVLVHAGGVCEVHDVASKNGTFVNGRKIAGPTRLASGDEIRMCDRDLVFVSKLGGKAPPPNDLTLTK